MFLIAITKDKIADSFQSTDVEEFKINSFIVTIITDNFLSKFILEKNGFSIIESPILKSSEFEEFAFVHLKYDEKAGCFNIFRPTISGVCSAQLNRP